MTLRAQTLEINWSMLFIVSNFQVVTVLRTTSIKVLEVTFWKENNIITLQLKLFNF